MSNRKLPSEPPIKCNTFDTVIDNPIATLIIITLISVFVAIFKWIYNG